MKKVIAYASKVLTETQRNYCTTKRKLLAVVRMIDTFRPYLWGRPFVVRTDHASLRWLLNFKDADGMLARWIAKLSQYNFRIQYREGKLHLNADALSRRKCRDCVRPDCPDKLLGPDDVCSQSTDSRLAYEGPPKAPHYLPEHIGPFNTGDEGAIVSPRIR